MSLRRCVGPIAAIALLLPLLAVGGASVFVVDGRGDDWSAFDIMGISTRPPSTANASVDLTSLSVADNSSHWFFRLGYEWLRPLENASLALYLFGPDDSSPAGQDPLGNDVFFPAGASLAYAIYIELAPSFPSGSKVVFYDGLVWKNRTFPELGVAAARNDSAAFVELAVPRASLTALEAGSAAAAALVPSGPTTFTVADAVPDDTAPIQGRIGGRVPFFDYALNPPVEFTALGISDPYATGGDTVAIFVELTNAGMKNVSGLSAHVLIDGTALGSGESLLLLFGGTTVLSFNWTAIAGSHNVTAVSFPGGAFRSIRLEIGAAGADLSIREANARPPSPALNEPFSVEVRVANDGNAPSAGLTLLLKDGTLVLSSIPLPAITPGNTTVVSLPARLSRPGLFLLRVEIDGTSSMNSTAQVPVDVREPSPPFGIPGPVVLAVGVAAAGLAAWALTPRLRRGRAPPPE